MRQSYHCKILVKIHQGKIAQVNEPIYDADYTTKDIFYEALQRKLNNFPRHDIFFVVGDLKLEAKWKETIVL